MKRFIVILGVMGTSFSSLFVRWSTAPSLVLVLYRVLMAAILLAPMVFWHHREELRNISFKDLALCSISGAFLGLHFAAYFESLQFTSVAAAVVLADTEVFFVAVGSVLFLRNRLSPKACLAILLTFCGSVVVALSGATAGGDVLRGNLLALSSALFMTVYTVIGAVCRKSLSTTVYTFFVYLFAVGTVLILSVASGTPVHGYRGVNLATALGMVVFCTLAGHSVFSWGLKYLPPAFISTSKLLEPVFSSVWALFAFAEKPGVPVVLGGIVVLLGISMYCRITEEKAAAA
jgi:drug/metabolite transporter (DMT)-like permease